MPPPLDRADQHQLQGTGPPRVVEGSNDDLPSWGTFTYAGTQAPTAAVPTAPAGVTATGDGTSVTVTWLPSAWADSYTVLRATAPDGPYGEIATGVGAPAHTDRDARGSRRYHYTVTAANAHGTSGTSAGTAAAARLPEPWAAQDLGDVRIPGTAAFDGELNNSFLTNHNDACVTNYWANWDLCNMASVMAIAILTDDGAKYDQAVTYFKSGAGNGSVEHAVPYLYTDAEGYALGQWQESGRDQGHTIMGMGQMGALCEMAWNQGDDLYSYDDRRFMKAAQYVAKYNTGQDVPYTTYTWGSGQNCAQQSQTVIGSGSRGQVRPVWAMLHFHYNRRLYLDDKYISAMYYDLVAPEGGGGDYGSTSGGYDQLGFGTLMYAK